MQTKKNLTSDQLFAPCNLPAFNYFYRKRLNICLIFCRTVAETSSVVASSLASPGISYDHKIPKKYFLFLYLCTAVHVSLNLSSEFLNISITWVPIPLTMKSVLNLKWGDREKRTGGRDKSCIFLYLLQILLLQSKNVTEAIKRYCCSVLWYVFEIQSICSSFTSSEFWQLLKASSMCVEYSLCYHIHIISPLTISYWAIFNSCPLISFLFMAMCFPLSKNI